MSRNRGQKKPSLHDLTREPIADEDWPMILHEMVMGTDRSCALVGCSIVDIALITALTTRMQPFESDEFEKMFFSPHAPLSSLSAKIRIGKAAGLYQNKLANALDVIRRIRNVFAHSARPLPFTHPLIAHELAQYHSYLLPEWFAERGLDISGLPTEKAKYMSLVFETINILEHVAALNSGNQIAVGWLDQPPQSSPEISAQPHPSPDRNQG